MRDTRAVYARIWPEEGVVKRRLYVIRGDRALKLSGGSADGSAAMHWCDVADFDERPGEWVFVRKDGDRAAEDYGGGGL